MTMQKEVLAIDTPTGMQLVCGWYARCANPTLKAHDHPAVGVVPVCSRCAEKAGINELDLIDCEVEVTA